MYVLYGSVLRGSVMAFNTAIESVDGGQYLRLTEKKIARERHVVEVKLEADASLPAYWPIWYEHLLAENDLVQVKSVKPGKVELTLQNADGFSSAIHCASLLCSDDVLSVPVITMSKKYEKWKYSCIFRSEVAVDMDDLVRRVACLDCTLPPDLTVMDIASAKDRLWYTLCRVRGGMLRRERMWYCANSYAFRLLNASPCP